METYDEIAECYENGEVSECREQASDVGLHHIGTGAFRDVYAHGQLVVKFASTQQVEYDVATEVNNIECDRWSGAGFRIREDLAPVTGCDENRGWVEMVRTNPDPDAFSEAVEIRERLNENGMKLGDVSATNIGTINGRHVLYDYGEFEWE